MAGNNLIVIKFDVDSLGKVSSTLAKLMVQEIADLKYSKEKPEMVLMDKQEYSKFREDQINDRIARLDAALEKVTKVVNEYYSAVSYDKGRISYNESMASSMRSQAVSEYSSCIRAQSCTSQYVPGYYGYYYSTPGYFTNSCVPRYSASYCASQMDFYNNLADGYDNNANDWRAQLRADQYELNIFSGVKKIFETYRAMAVASKEDIPFELGLFMPPSEIKIVLEPDAKIETLADYFGTVVHEYFHYTSYISDENKLPTFFEEGLTEYFARKAIRENMGIETNEGYPLIVKVIERMMEKIPEDKFQEVYFAKNKEKLASVLDESFGKDFYKNNELYFEYISYIPPKESLEITNELLEKIGVQKLTEEELFSKSSEF
jgi:hypothetical protein